MRRLNNNIVNSRCYNHSSVNFDTCEFEVKKREFEFEFDLNGAKRIKRKEGKMLYKINK
jgi:predicted RNA-binding protein with PUA domain